MAAVAISMPSPPVSAGSSPSSSPLKRRHSPKLSLDLNSIPPLVQPSPPSNTLLITNLQAPEIFTGHILDNILKAINEHAPVRTFSPLKSMRRIICTFNTTEDAIAIRQTLDGETVLGSRVRVYFGQMTKIDNEDQHLRAPQSQKLFFISPPPSPPVGWEMRNEEPPNTEVHADDLVAALAKLQARPSASDALADNEHEMHDANTISSTGTTNTHHSGTRNDAPRLNVVTRQRSSTGTILYDPEEQGHSPLLPAIAVEDTSASPEGMSPTEDGEKKFLHTARPPVELMDTSA